MKIEDKEIDSILEDSQKNLIEEMKKYNFDDDDYVEEEEEEEETEEEELTEEEIEEKKKKRKKTIFKSFTFALELLVIFLLSFAMVMLIMPNSKAWLTSTAFGKMFMKQVMTEKNYNNIVDENYNREDTGINEELDTSILDNYTNIALFGLDARRGELENGVQSDCMIIVSINKETKEVRMVSVYRDTLLQCFDADGNGYYGKCNSSYNHGGPAATVKMLNTNLDLNIQDYVTVNFNSLSDIIDRMGGLDVYITGEEAFWINYHLKYYYQEIGRPDEVWDQLIEEKEGLFHLNGIQATTYSRIRQCIYYGEDGSVTADDFGRTARQRNIINKMVDKAKFMGLDNILKLADEVFKNDQDAFLTSVPYDDVIELIPVILNFSMANSSGYPQKYVAYGGSDLAPNTLVDMVKGIHKDLFGVKNYKVSSTVEQISADICSMAGIASSY